MKTLKELLDTLNINANDVAEVLKISNVAVYYKLKNTYNWKPEELEEVKKLINKKRYNIDMTELVRLAERVKNDNKKRDRNAKNKTKHKKDK